MGIERTLQREAVGLGSGISALAGTPGGRETEVLVSVWSASGCGGALKERQSNSPPAITTITNTVSTTLESRFFFME